MRLDARDLDILRVLSVEGRITKAELAERVGLSASPCWERLSRLEKAGIIDGYRARINLRKLGPHVIIFVAVELSEHTAASFRAFEAYVDNRDEIIACWALGGGFDYFLQTLTRDVECYQQLIDDLLAARVGVVRYYTYIVTKPIKGAGVPPFEALLGDET